MLPIIFFMPLVQLVLLSFAATFEIKSINFHLIDNDQTTYSRLLVQKFSSTNYFHLINSSHSEKVGYDDLAHRKVKMVLIIPKNFERDIYKQTNPKLQFVINAEDGSAAGIIQSYAIQITNNFNKLILNDFHLISPTTIPKNINVISEYWYNPELDYKEYMVPGILVVLVTIIGMFLSAMNVVREKEIGTIEQLNVTPIKKYQFIIGKLLPFWIISIIILAFGLTLAVLIFGIVIRGNILLIFSLSSLYLVVVLGYGLFISTITDTMQQALFIAWFFGVVFILMGGLFTPIDSMPHWAQIITLFNPVSHFIEIMRRVILKGSGFWEVQRQVLVLSVYAVLMVVLSVWRYKKVSG